MENQELIARVTQTVEAWGQLSPFTNTAYEILLQEEEFWDPSSGVQWSRPIFWQEVGNA